MGSVEVAVIGAGVAGLVAARELRREGHRVTMFEKSGKVGGIWVYDPRVESDPLGVDPNREIVHSSMYLSLRTNLPRPLMGFSDFNMTERDYGDPRMFPGHHEVSSFLNHFAAESRLLHLIRFHTQVVRVESILTGQRRQWVVEALPTTGVKSEELFDAVVICNGHVTVPRLPHIPGLEKWPGKQTHSHNYRVPEPFTDEVVIIIGNGASAYDISRDIAKVSKEVHLSSRSPNEKLSRLDAYPNIWLHSASLISKWKLLSTVEIPPSTILFLMMELQSKWIAQVLSGKVSLPSKKDMMADIDYYFRQMEEMKRPIHQTHFLYNPEEFGYLDWIAEQVGSPPVEEWKKEMYRKIIKQIECHDDEFREE